MDQDQPPISIRVCTRTKKKSTPRLNGKTTYYTVIHKAHGHEVKSIHPVTGKESTFPVTFDDPAQACKEFELAVTNARYLDTLTFNALLTQISADKYKLQLWTKGR